MFLSIVVTAYNAERWIMETLESILVQTHADFEVLIVDDGSTDRTLQIINQYAKKDNRVIAITQPNQGMAKAANYAIKQARADWIVRIDADDLMMPMRLERQIAFVKANPDIVVSSCLVYYINEAGKIISKYASDLTTREDFDQRFANHEAIGLHHQGVIMRKDIFLEVGGYRGEFWPSDDMELWNRMAEKGYVLVQPEYLQKYRIHGSSISNTDIRTQHAKWRWIEMCVRCRRTGEQEPAWEDFLNIECSRPLPVRLNHWRRETSKVLYKRATLAFSSGQKPRTLINILGAMIFDPIYSLNELNKKYFHLCVPRRLRKARRRNISDIARSK